MGGGRRPGRGSIAPLGTTQTAGTAKTVGAGGTSEAVRGRTDGEPHFAGSGRDLGSSDRANCRVELALAAEGLRAVAALSDRELAGASLAQRTRILARCLSGSLSLWRKAGLGKHAGLDLSALTHRVLSTATHPDELDAMMNAVGARRLREHLHRGRNSVVFSKSLDTLRQRIVPGDWSRFGEYLEKVSAAEPGGKNRLTLLMDEAFLPEIAAAIEGAKESIDVHLFVAEGNAPTRKIFDLLEAKAREGKQVRVSLDGYGTRSYNPHTDAWMAGLRAAGVEVYLRPAPPLRDHLDHRKIWVIDGRVAYIGGMNLGESYHSKWHDQQTRVEGPAVGPIERLFERAFSARSGAKSRFEPGKRAPARAPTEKESGRGADATAAQTHLVFHDGGRADENIKFAYLRAIRTAAESIRVASPYFTDKDVVDALCDAARRGVKVELMLPREIDQRFMLDAARILYKDLLAAGVEIYEHTERMVHLKVAVFDDRAATVGSSNLDARSLEFNDEANLFVDDKEFAQAVTKQIFEANRPKCERISEIPEDAPKRAYRYILKQAMDLL